MKVLKPSWVHHNDNPIFSIDVHPDGSRFATGGQGQDSGKIIIWNMGPVIDSNKEKDKNVPKILCQMDHHIACVNTVRWSNNGLFLASGSDDKLIMIWQYANGGMGYQNIENWKCGYTLRSHSGDVMDLAWSSKDQFLASCSVDNTVIIWNALKFPEIINRINAHAGLVKGVAWDPVGTFLASQSDDKTLKIWRTLDWSQEKCIDEPFKQCAGTTHVLRLSWSPDGQIILSAHAINNGAPTAQVIDRGNKWNTKLDFVGHRKAVTSVRFFPQILKPCEMNTKDLKTHCLCALGSRDRSISIWLTKFNRPLCVIHDLFDNPIMDLSWSMHPNPGLLSCSMDGTVSYIEFDYKEIGYPLTKNETEEFFMKKYNYDVNASIALKSNNINQQLNQQGSGSTNKIEANTIKFIENLDILLAQELKKQSPIEINENSNQTQQNTSRNLSNSSQTITPSKLQMLTENRKQIERRMPDGRRRITPICVSKPGEYDTPKPFGSDSNFNKVGYEKSIGFGSPHDVKIVSKTATEQSTIIIEKRDNNNEVVEVSPIKSIVYSKQNNQSALNSNTNSNEPNFNKSNENAAAVVAFKNMEVQKLTTTNESLKQNELMKQTTASTSQNNSKIQINAKSTPITSKTIQITNEQNKTVSVATNSKNSIQQKQQTNTNKTNSTLNKSVVNNQQSSLNSIENSNLNLNTSINDSDDLLRQTAKRTINYQNEKNTKSINSSNVLKNQTINFLEPLRIDKKFITKIICEKTLNRSAVSIEIHNSFSLINRQSLTTNDSENQLSLIKYLVDYKFKWQTYFTSRICEIVSSSYLVACACNDMTLHLLKAKNGSQLCCPILLDSCAAVLKCNSNYCMCLTVNGFVYVWKLNIDEQVDNLKSNSFGKQTCNLLSKSISFDFNNLTTHINRQSCQSILKDGVFMNALLTENGIPVIYMSKNRSFFFSLQSECWHLVPTIGNLVGEDSHLLLSSKSLFADHSKSINKQDDPNNTNKIVGPLSIIQSREKSSNLLKTIELINKGTLNDNPLFNQHDFTLTHLESQVNASLGLNSAKEYKFWLLTYSRYLAENDYEDKLSDLCDFLLGPLYSLSWNETILTFKKRDLLKEILLIMAQNLRFQRLYSFYKQQLNLVSNAKSKNNILSRLNARERNEEQLINPILPIDSSQIMNRKLDCSNIRTISNNVNDFNEESFLKETNVLNETEEICLNGNIANFIEGSGRCKENEISTNKETYLNDFQSQNLNEMNENPRMEVADLNEEGKKTHDIIDDLISDCDLEVDKLTKNRIEN